MRAVLLALSLLLPCSLPASASHHHHQAHHHHHRQHGRQVFRESGWGDPRPAAWCGWYMRHLLHVPDRSLNLARNWARWGHATYPHRLAVAVWPHHVALIMSDGPDRAGRWLMRSGNDGHAVRTRPRSLAGAIAFRI